MKHNFHSHTLWCNHASFSAEELIRIAIKHKFETWGISEHIYSPCGFNDQSLGTEHNANAFIDQINALKVKYQSQTRVLLAFEMEIVDPFSGIVMIDFINKIAASPHVDYLIAGYHFYADHKDVYSEKPTPARLEEMIGNLELLFERTPIRYLAHPDAFVEGNSGWENWMTPYAARIVDLALKHDVALGLNINGIYKNRLYPCTQFWQIAGAKKARAILELDAHSEGPFKKEYIEKAKSLAARFDVNLIEKYV